MRLYRIFISLIVKMKRFIKRKEYKEFNVLLNKNEIEHAREIGEFLHRYNSKDIPHGKKMAEILTSAGKSNLATSIVRSGLPTKVNCIIDSEVKNINALLELDYKLVMSEDVFGNGLSNLRMIEHRCTSNNITNLYLTKIAWSHSIYKEIYFYESIREQHPIFKDFTPNFIRTIKIKSKNIHLLTIEKVQGTRASKEQIAHIIDTHKKITSISYKEALLFCKYSEFESVVKRNMLWFLRKRIAMKQTFAFIHKKTANTFIFRKVLYQMKRCSYSNKSIGSIKRLRNLIFNTEFYKKIDPDIHYSLIHGDYHVSNIIFAPEDNHCNIIDWNSYGVGPVSLDMTYIVRRFKYTYKEIDEIYLSKSDNLDDVGKILFIYMLIIEWFNNLDQKTFDNNYENNLLPAINHAELLMGRKNLASN